VGDGKAALALAPSKQLPDVVRSRAKTGFAVPTGDWISRAIMPGRSATKGQASRGWSKVVLDGSGMRMVAAA